MLKKASGWIVLALIALVFSSNAFAESNTQFSIDVSDAALQLTVPPTASIELNPTTSSAVFGSTNVTINVATNNITGYRIIMSVPSTNLTHNSLSNTVIPTLSAASTESNFPANAWGYKVVGDDYEPILTSNTPASWVVEEPTNGTNHTMTLAAKVDGTKPSGNYTNTLTFQAVANPNAPKDTIVYNGNGADGGSMANQQIWQGEYSKLAKNTYTRSGYLFNGWNTYADNSGSGYGDEDDYYSVVTNTATTITLYAQWVEDTGQGSAGKTLQDAYEMAYVTNPGKFQEGGNNKHGLYVPEKDPVTGDYTGDYFEATKASDYEGIPANDLRFAIQDISLEINGVKICDYATVIGSTAYVLDLRDFNSYHIVKAKDGRCWLADNLALDLTAEDAIDNINPSNTNADANALEYLFGVKSREPGTDPNGILATGGVTTWSSSYSFEKPMISTSNIEVLPTTYTYPLASTLVYGQDEPLAATVRAEKWRVGVFYNYCAASAGSYCPDYNSAGVDKPGTAIDAESDICPSGWRLPTGSSYDATDRPDGGELQTLYDAFNHSSDSLYLTKIRKTLRLPLAGFFNYNKPAYQSATGYYWSSTYSGTLNQMHMLHLTTNGFSPQASDFRMYGMPVRCIAK